MPGRQNARTVPPPITWEERQDDPKESIKLIHELQMKGCWRSGEKFTFN